ncbi:MAG TPA: YggS family pyridoxal phosphate-dependent enzyme [Actinomycetota bacterium]|jgi:pyridoxal phosphate enzyme (YggS family)|nr:YggS family pyridoxal phosphate-dependent enzyme [Actinomycetota bacterium]
MVLRSRDAIGDNVARIIERIAEACRRAGRERSEVRLVGASKTVGPEAIGWAFESGVREFGENYVGELRDKRGAVPDATWHFIGTLQSHTVHHVADLADVVQTLAPGSAVRRLGRRAVRGGRRLVALIEVDFTGARTGVAPERASAFVDEVASVEGLQLVGLMTMPPFFSEPEEARPFFRRLRELRDRLARDHPSLTELSMGMSMDFPVAIEEGATMVRIGTALFGERPPTT